MAYIEELYFSDNRLLIPIINLYILDHPISPSRECLLIDYAYIVLESISGISIDFNGNLIDIPPRLGVFQVFDSMKDCFYICGTNSKEHYLEISTDDQTHGAVYVRKHYKLSNQWHEFLPFAEEYGYDVAKYPSKIILPAAETRSFFFDPPFDLLGGSYERLALY